MPIKGGLMAPHPPLIIPEVGRGQERKIQATIDGYYKGARKAGLMGAGNRSGNIAPYGYVRRLFSYFSGKGLSDSSALLRSV